MFMKELKKETFEAKDRTESKAQLLQIQDDDITLIDKSQEAGNEVTEDVMEVYSYASMKELIDWKKERIQADK